MNLKKNTFSYLTWIVLLFFTGVTCTFFSLVLGQSLRINMVLIAVLIVTLFFGLLFLTYYLTGYILRKGYNANKYLGMEKLINILEKILVITFISIGFVIRILFISSAGEEAAYFEVSKVSEQGGILIKSVQGSVYFYCMLLHGVFKIFGNQWMAGIWLQIILQFIGAIILYFALRNIMHKFGALSVLAIIMFTPATVKAGLTYSPQMLYFCIFATALYFISLILKNSSEQKTETIIQTIIAGLFAGICCYVDITGLLLIIPVFCLLLLERDSFVLKPIWQVIICLAVLMLTFLGVILLDSIMSNIGMGNILHAWRVIYGDVGFDLTSMTTGVGVDVLVLSALSCFGCVSFWRRKKTEIFTPYVWMTVGCLLFVFFGITTENMNGSYLLTVMLAVMAVVSVTELFYREKLDGNEIDEIEVESEKEKVDNKEQNPKVEYIENPLPLPKKHIRKTMDYAFVPNEKQMKYDVYVPENDDFDLK